MQRPWLWGPGVLAPLLLSFFLNAAWAQAPAGHREHFLTTFFLLATLHTSLTVARVQPYLLPPSPTMVPQDCMRGSCLSGHHFLFLHSPFPSPASLRLTECTQENPKHHPFATCKTHQLLWASASHLHSGAGQRVTQMVVMVTIMEMIATVTVVMEMVVMCWYW